MRKPSVKASAKKQATPPVKRSAKSAKQMESDHPRSSAPYPGSAKPEPDHKLHPELYDEKHPDPKQNPANQLSPGVTIDPQPAENGDRQVIYVTAEGKHVPCCASHIKAVPPEQRTDRARLVARHDPKVLVKDWVQYAADKTPNTWHYPDPK